MAAAPVPVAEPAPESERPAVPPDDLAAAQMRMLVVGEILAEEAADAQQSQSESASLDAPAGGADAEAAAAPPVLDPPLVTGDEASCAEDPPPLDD